MPLTCAHEFARPVIDLVEIGCGVAQVAVIEPTEPATFS